MSYERQAKLGKMAWEMNTAAKHIANAEGAARRAIETAGTVSPELADETRRFFAQNVGLMRDVAAIGNYIGQVMYDQYDMEMGHAISSGYENTSGYPGGRGPSGVPALGRLGLVRSVQ